MSLRNEAIRVVELKGLAHNLALRGLRQYLKEHRDDEMVREISDIIEAPLLRALWEAGLRAPFQEAVMKQLEKIEKRG